LFTGGEVGAIQRNKLLSPKGRLAAKGGVVAEAEHLPNRKISSDTELAIETFVDDMSEIYPDLDREEFRDEINRCVQEHLPEEEDSDEEEEGQGLTDRAKGLLQKAAGALRPGGSSREDMRSIIRESVERSERGQE
jgi:hypothetical protein